MLYWITLLVLLFVSAPAFAQTATEAPGLPTGLALTSLIVGLIVGAALMALRRIAPLTKNTYDDKVLTFLREAEPVIRRWMDPDDPSVPPSPGG